LQCITIKDRDHAPPVGNESGPFKFLERYRNAGSLYAKHSTKELMGEAYFVAVNSVIVATANRMLRDCNNLHG
jgi:hypothetical protein